MDREDDHEGRYTITPGSLASTNGGDRSTANMSIAIHHLSTSKRQPSAASRDPHLDDDNDKTMKRKKKRAAKKRRLILSVAGMFAITGILGFVLINQFYYHNNVIDMLRDNMGSWSVDYAHPLSPTITNQTSGLGLLQSLKYSYLHRQYRRYVAQVRKQIRRISSRYKYLLVHYPFKTRVFTTISLIGFSDILAQVISGERFSIRRSLNYMAYGLPHGTLLFLWYYMTFHYGPEDDLLGSLSKALFEQVTLEPWCISNYMLWYAMTHRISWQETRIKYKTDFIPLYKRNMIFWLPANFCAYMLITPEYRILFVNFCSFCWMIFVSWFVNRSKKTREKDRESLSDRDWDREKERDRERENQNQRIMAAAMNKSAYTPVSHAFPPYHPHNQAQRKIY